MGVFFVKTVMYAKVEGKVGGAVERRRAFDKRPLRVRSGKGEREGQDPPLQEGVVVGGGPTGAVALSVSFADSGIKVCLPPASI